MTDTYFFDTDCLSAFLWVRNESILAQLYPGQVVLPIQVYDELRKVPHLLARVDAMKADGNLRVQSIMVGTAEYDDYQQMVIKPPRGTMVIGKGEAAAIALARQNKGILASNNMRDISVYVEKYGLKHITTGDILMEALEKGIITEEEGNLLWLSMKKKKRMLPTATFTEYCSSRRTVAACCPNNPIANSPQKCYSKTRLYQAQNTVRK